ncbi:17786_t:CDS:2, partial [Acaulospora morrowiae]
KLINLSIPLYSSIVFGIIAVHQFYGVVLSFLKKIVRGSNAVERRLNDDVSKNKSKKNKIKCSTDTSSNSDTSDSNSGNSSASSSGIEVIHVKRPFLKRKVK